jgi:hypothetical protein
MGELSILSMSQPSSVQLQSTPILQPSRQYIDAFFEFVYPFVPVFHKPTFFAHLDEQPLALLSIMHAFGLRYQVACLSATPDQSHSDLFFHQSRRLVDKDLELPKESTLQTVLLLSIYAGSKILLGFLSFVFLYFILSSRQSNSHTSLL